MYGNIIPHGRDIKKTKANVATHSRNVNPNKRYRTTIGTGTDKPTDTEHRRRVEVKAGKIVLGIMFHVRKG